MGKNSLSFRRLSSIRHPKNGAAAKALPPPPMNTSGTVAEGAEKAKKKTGGARMWMRFDLSGAMEVVECDKSTIIKRTSVSARDLRVLGPVFSNSSIILARGNAIVVNLEVVKVIVTAEEVLLLDPLRPEVLPLVDRLKQQFRPQSSNVSENVQASSLPFEFHVLEIALDLVCSFFDTCVASLETNTWPILDELTKNVTIENLEYIRSAKSNATRLLSGVQKVRDVIERLLDDNEDMADLYLTRRWIQRQHSEAMLASNRGVSMVTNKTEKDDDVEDLEMLLEAYLMQVEGMRNKIVMVREYIGDTEDYVKIQQKTQRNETLQLQQLLNIAMAAIAGPTTLAGVFGMNIHCSLYDTNGIFGYVVCGIIALGIVIFMLAFGYARWKKLL